MSITAIATGIKTSVATELEKVQLPEGIEISTEVKQQLADAGVRGTLTALDGLSNATISYITGDVEAGTDDVAGVTPGELISELFAAVNS